MPKIVIKEEDYTTPGLEGYANFSVVVPGFCGKEPNDGIFDENGIYEVSLQKDFIDNVGALDENEFSTRAFAKAEVLDSEGIGIEKYRHTISAKEFYSTFADELYTTTDEADGNGPAENEGKDWLLIITQTASGTTNSYYKLTKVLETAEYDPTVKYLVVKPGNEGHDLTSDLHYGNQIAYELLGLGYPVLFKKLEAKTSEVSWADFFSPLEDKSAYDFRFIISGYLNPDADCSNALASLATKRGDCIAVLDIPENAYAGKSISEAKAGIIEAVNGVSEANKYSAFIVPSLCYNINSEYYSNSKFPGSFHYLACFAHSVRDLNFAEWYAAAGLTRGVSKYPIKSTSYKFGENIVNALEPRFQVDGLTKAVNVIAKFRDNYLLWGNRTAEQLGIKDSSNGDLIASHFLNIRQLCTTLKKELYIACRRFTFDPNSDVLWINFCNTIKPVLEAMKADQGIDNYEIVKVEASQKALLKARVRIVPIEAVEDFEITVTLENSLGDTTVSVNE